MHFVRAVVIMIATILGLGILGLPAVFARAGFGVGLVELILVGVALTFLYLMYAEMTIDLAGKHRYVGYMRHYLGQRAGTMAGWLFIIGMFGGMMPFLIVTGPFLQTLFGVDPLAGSLFLWILAAGVIFGGIKGIMRIELGIIIGLLGVYSLAMIFGSPHFFLENITLVQNRSAIFLPVGVILFALGGIGAIPEMHDLLGRRRRSIGKAIWCAMLFLMMLYAGFSFFTLGVFGTTVSENPLPQLALLLPGWLGFLVLLIGTISAFSIFTVVGTEVAATMRVDFGWSHWNAWAFSSVTPLLLFLAGARELTSVMGFFGSLFGAAIGLCVLFAYGKTNAPRLVPLWVRYPVALVFVFGALVEILL